MDEERREAHVNWEQQIKTLIDNYYSKIGNLQGLNNETAMAHALQKDAIQNCLDALDPKSKDEWTIEIAISNISSKGKPARFISITDKGTYGLTGRAYVGKNELMNLTPKQSDEEKWTRFESLAFRNPDPRARGARGQGKFIFIGNSKIGKIIYDTLRKDGIYRVGEWDTKKSEPLIKKPHEGESAKKYLKDEVPDLEPLKNVGARIIILQPSEEISKAFIPFKQNDLARYISEVWWEALLEGKNILITILDEGWKKKVDPPDLYAKLWENPDKFTCTRIENVRVSEEFKKAKVKELVIAYTESELPPLLQGIAVQRGKMKVESFDITYGNDHIPPKYRNHVFGWIIFNEDAEEELKKSEDPTHYNFNKRIGTFAWEALGRNGFLSRMIKKFAEEKLGISPSGKEREKAEKSYLETLNRLNKIASLLGYKGGKRKRGGKRGEKEKKVSIIIPEPTYPRESKRVEFGENVSNIICYVMNGLNIRKEVKLEFTLKRKGPVFGQMGEEVLKNFAEKELDLEKGGKSDEFGPFEITFEKGSYEAGIYVIEGRVLEMGAGEKGKELDLGRHLIYLSRDPPAVSGMFKELVPEKFDPPLHRLQYRTWLDEKSKSIILYINTGHPLYKKASELKDILNEAKVEDINPIENYALSIGVIAILTEDLKDKGKIFKKEKYLKPLEKVKKEDTELFFEILESLSKIQQEYLSDTLK
jgi:hypothetical protein